MTPTCFLLIIPEVIRHGDKNEMKLHWWAFFLLFQYVKHFCLCEQSLFGQNIHQLDTQGACSMTSYGQIKEFFASTAWLDNLCWETWYYFRANCITDANGVLLWVCGMETFSLLKDLITPDSLQDKTFDELWQTLEEHSNTEPFVIVERFNFHMYRQQPNQTISNFIAQLKK